MSDESTITGPTASNVSGTRRTVRDWFLLGGNRLVIALVFMGLFLVVFSGMLRWNLVPLLNLQPVFYAYGGLISGNLTLITVVVSVNQFLLSRELGTPGELDSQIENVIEYRREVEDAAGQVAPVEPLGFLRVLVEVTRSDSQKLGGLARGNTVTDGDEEIEEVVTRITNQMDRIDGLLDRSSSDTIDVLSTMLATNYARQINRLRRVKHGRNGELPDVVEGSIDDLIDRLQHLDIARQYFKTIYFEQELSSFSRLLLYVGLPAQVIAIATLLLCTVPTSDPYAVTAIEILLPVSLTILLMPLALLASFIIRTATVTKRTAAIIPFTSPEQEK